MEKASFEDYLHRARDLRVLASGEQVDFLNGYERGLRRAFYGDNFGADERDAYIHLHAADSDPARRARVRGYKAGIAGEAPALPADTSEVLPSSTPNRDTTAGRPRRTG